MFPLLNIRLHSISRNIGTLNVFRCYCNNNPRQLCLIAFSGKRRAGKDQGADLVMDAIKKHSSDSDPVWITKQSIGLFPKEKYCIENNVDLQQVLKDDHFKEKHRSGIIDVASSGREKDSLIWIRQCYDRIIEEFKKTGKTKGFCFVPDIRFKDEVDFIIEKQDNDKSNNFIISSKLVRVTANDNVRKERGWEYIEGVDKHNTEIHLDNCDNLWQFQFQNHTNDLVTYEKTLSPLINELKEIL